MKTLSKEEKMLVASIFFSPHFLAPLFSEKDEVLLLRKHEVLLKLWCRRCCRHHAQTLTFCNICYY